jgi:hypothetical protein
MVSEEGIIFFFIISKKNSVIVLAYLFQHFFLCHLLEQMFLEQVGFYLLNYFVGTVSKRIKYIPHPQDITIV